MFVEESLESMDTIEIVNLILVHFEKSLHQLSDLRGELNDYQQRRKNQRFYSIFNQ